MYYYYAKNRKKINPDNINFISNLANSFSPVTEWPGDIFTTEIENGIFEQESGAIKVTKQEAQIIVNRSLRNKVLYIYEYLPTPNDPSNVQGYLSPHNVLRE